MFLKPTALREFLSRNNYMDEMYDALAQDDTSEVVMTALRILRKTNNLRAVYGDRKSKESSTMIRNEGNKAFRLGQYQKALRLYNEALLLAPKNSRELKLAIGNRSALFHKLEVWTACYNDVIKCFDMGCPSDIEEKLNKRKKDALPHLNNELFLRNLMHQTGEKCVDSRAMKQNTEIPCASSDIKVDTSTGMPKVIAATNIRIGTVLALEQAYVSYTHTNNSSVSCHFCQRKALNLLPCEGCCFALFCNEECKYKCMKEYHEYECLILNAITELCHGHMPNLMVKACLKLRKSCKSWDELITASHNMGISRIKCSSVQEIYDTNSKFSILCFKDDKPFVYGALYNASYVIAAILHYLDDQIPSFLPKNTDEKNEAMRALARIMMFLSVYQIPLHTIQGQNSIRFEHNSYGLQNFGLFPFISKLKRSCNPNSVLINNNNKLILIALRPLKSGEELTITYLWHRFDTKIDKHAQNITTYLFYGKVCDCHRCTDNNTSQVKNDGAVLSKYQRKYFSKLDLDNMEEKLQTIQLKSIYQKLVKALYVLNDVPYSKEYYQIYNLWRQCLFFFEVICGDNSILDFSV